MAIGQTDKETTAALRKKEERKAKTESRASRSSDNDGLCTGEQPEDLLALDAVFAFLSSFFLSAAVVSLSVCPIAIFLCVL